MTVHASGWAAAWPLLPFARIWDQCVATTYGPLCGCCVILECLAYRPATSRQTVDMRRRNKHRLAVGAARSSHADQGPPELAQGLQFGLQFTTARLSSITYAGAA